MILVNPFSENVFCPQQTNGKQWSLLRPKSSRSRTRSGKVSANIVWVRLNTFALLSPPSKNGFLSNRLKRKAPASTRTSSQLSCLLTSVQQQPLPVTSAPTSSMPTQKHCVVFTTANSTPASSSPSPEASNDAVCAPVPLLRASTTVPAMSTFARVPTFLRHNGVSMGAACGRVGNTTAVFDTAPSSFIASELRLGTTCIFRL